MSKQKQKSKSKVESKAKHFPLPFAVRVPEFPKHCIALYLQYVDLTLEWQFDSSAHFNVLGMWSMKNPNATRRNVELNFNALIFFLLFVRYLRILYLEMLVDSL